MLTKSLLLIATAALSVASPVSRRQGLSCSPPVLPVNGGARELAAPTAGSTLKHIALGVGIQNYTCTADGATPASAGALAMLYDVTALYPGQSADSLTKDAFNALSSTALWAGPVPLNMNNSTGSSGASLTNPFPADGPLELDGLSLPFAGHHFFNTEGVPTFIVDAGAIDLIAAKLDGIIAPAGADPGPQGTGAVDWLYLGAKAGSVGATAVYRVLTAGGVSHGCANGVTADSTTYAATYWFYD